MALVKRSQAKFCADVRVLPSVDTWSDHQLCRLKMIQVPERPWEQRIKAASAGRPRRLPVSLAGADFAEAVDEALADIHSMEEAQGVIRKVAEDTLTCSSMNRPAWQRDNADRLRELSQKRQQAFNDLREKRTDADRKRYRDVCKMNRNVYEFNSKNYYMY